MNKRRIDVSTILGVLVAVSGVVAGLLLDGGTLKQVLQPTAALIVLGGTLGAVMIQFPLHTVFETFKQLRHGLFDPGPLSENHIEELAGYCQQVRRHGILALDARLDEVEDAFLRKGLTLAVDGVPIRDLREIMEVDLDLFEDREDCFPRVLDAAGGFAPTLGIVGAVLGLIQVMQHMENVGEIGKGIAVAFVSTLYGIALANLFFLPLAGKLRIRMREKQILREMMLEAIVGILEGLSARALRHRLQTFVVARPVKQKRLAQVEMAGR